MKGFHAQLISSSAASGVSPAPLMATTLMFILTAASFGRYAFFALLPLAAYPAYLAALAGISAGRLIYKLLPLSPFILFVAAANLFFDEGQVLIAGVDIPAGWLSFSTITLKFLLTVGAVTATASLAGFDALCRELASLGLPQLLVDQFFLFYRYVNLVGSEASNVVRARLFRGGSISVGESGNIFGPLAIRCFARSRGIHRALRCRGYEEILFDGKSKGRRWSFSDKIFVLVWAVLFAAVRLGLPAMTGALIMGK